MATIILKYGLLIVLIVILVLSIISILNLTKREFNLLVQQGQERINDASIELISEEDLHDLPFPVKKYLEYVGVVGTEKILSYTVEFSGEFKMHEDKEFSSMTAYQTSYNIEATRLFYMTLKYSGIKIVGLHHFENENATMKIKILDLLKVVDESGEIMNQSETVTMFNDMALLAPATLLDDRITWEEIDDYHVVGHFTNGSIVVSATFEFNDQYQLINFISEDRYAIADGKSQNVTWSTPVTEYQEKNGLNLPYKGSAIWHFEDHDFEYIKLVIENIEYNKGLK